MNLLTISDVAKRMRISTKSVYRMFHSGKLTPLKIGRNTRINEDEFNNYLNSLPEGLR